MSKRQLRWRRLLCKANCIIMDCKILIDLQVVYIRFKYPLAWHTIVNSCTLIATNSCVIYLPFGFGEPQK